MVDDGGRSALGRAIASRRGEIGLKRNDLRDRSGLSYPYIAELETGRKRPSQAALDALARALELSTSELLARAERLAPFSQSNPDDRSERMLTPELEELVRRIVRDELRRAGIAMTWADAYGPPDEKGWMPR